ncbi:hypothetical protein B0H19DRAFT_1180275 [Mycena capillaripes]|nr:hypothetical protein B0H19DRAFT_1180275 [Mycena capillaripes]
MVSTHQAPLSIRFIVVGGSVAGLACAYVLREAGHDVVVLEKTDGKTKTRGSIRSPPNMTRILNEWPGVETLLRTRASKCGGYGFRRADTLERVGFMNFYEQIMEDLQADFLVLQHDDLCSHLASICLTAGVDIKYGCKADAITSADGSVTVTLEDGSSLSGDIVIGADGHSSLVRAAIVAEYSEDELEIIHTVVGINLSVPTKIVEELEDFKSLCSYDELTLWMGSESSVVGCLDSKAETFNLSICSPASLEIDSDWDANSLGKKILPFDLSGYDPRLRKLIDLANVCYPTVHQLLNQEETVGLDATAVLIGDAAHEILIHGSHNSAIAIEDAATLGRLFSRLSNRSQIPRLLNAYHEIRHGRTSSTQESEYQALLQISMDDAAYQEARDTGLKASLTMTFEDFHDVAGDNMLVQIWEQYLELFSYNAAEEVDSWWSMWGHVVDEAGDEEA